MAAHIRPARRDDAEALAAIEETLFESDRLSKRSFRHLIASPSAAVLAAGDESSLEGYCVVLFRARSSRARLYSIAAKPKNPGLGRALLGAAETEACRRGRALLALEVREDNARAIDLYSRSAYRPAGRIEGYYEDGAAALRYERLLDAARPPPGGGPGTAQS